MKKLLYIFVFCCIGLSLTAQEPLKTIPKPPSETSINDLAGILDPQQEQLLNDRLIALKRSSSNEIAIATIETLHGGDLEGVANETYRSWGIGTAKNNNGVLILVVKGDRKVRIEVGYGLEGAIPDGVAGSIIRNDMQPLFRQEDYYHGLLKAVESLSKAAVGEYNIPHESKAGRGTSGSSIFKFIIAAIFIIIFLGSRGGGGRGGRGGRVVSRGGSDWLGPLIIGSMLGGGRGGGGFGGGGGGFGGGGFGGFGGGSSGGGGASGSW